MKYRIDSNLNTHHGNDRDHARAWVSVDGPVGRRRVDFRGTFYAPHWEVSAELNMDGMRDNVARAYVRAAARAVWGEDAEPHHRRVTSGGDPIGYSLVYCAFRTPPFPAVEGV